MTESGERPQPPPDQPSDEPADQARAQPGAQGPSRSRGVVADAVADLTGRLGIDPTGIRVVSVEEVTWRDGSMGCPRPGMMYTQVLTNGSRVVLEADGSRYQYHAGGRRAAFLCENPQPPAGP